MSTKQSTKQSTKKKSSTSQTGSSSTGDVTKKSKKKETKTRAGSFSKGVTSKKAEPVDVVSVTFLVLQREIRIVPYHRPAFLLYAFLTIVLALLPILPY